MKNLMLAASAFALLASAGHADDATPQSPTFGSFGIDLTNIDPAVDAGDDFNRHINGKWLDSFEIPADKSRYGVFNYLADGAEIDVREIIEDAAANAPPIDTLEGKVAAHYSAFLDTNAINARGMEPAQPYLEQIAAIETREDLATVFASNGFSAPFGGFVDVDSKNTESYIFYVTQGGLGLPDRSYYLEDTASNLEIRTAYLEFLTTMLTEAGYDAPAEAAPHACTQRTRLLAHPMPHGVCSCCTRARSAQVFARLFGVAVHVYEPLAAAGSFQRIASFQPPHETEQQAHLLYRGGVHYDALHPA